MSDGFEWDFASRVEGEVPPAEAPAAPAPSAGLAPGATFGERFLLLDVLGRGGAGVVYRAREVASGRDLALKVLSAGRLGPRQLERFRREGELTAALQHPGIVRVHSAGELAGVPFLAYELIPGGRSLEEVLQGGDPDRAVRLVQEAAEAVGHAHARGVVHRDLKPSNVLIDAEGRTRVADFGLALASGLTRMTQTGTLIGTPSYMSPEQVSGRRDLGPQSDVWSLGVILYQALTGRLPFDSPSFFELARKVLEARPTPPRKVHPGIPPALERVCLRALAFDPADRQPDAGVLAFELAGALAGRPVGSSRRRARTALGLLGLAGLGVGLGVPLAGWLGRAGAESELRAALAAARQDPAGLAALESALAAGDGPPALRAEAHLLLADAAPPAARLAHARAARSLRDDGPAAWTEGQALLALGRPEEALEPLRRAAALDPAPPVQLALGRTLLAAGRAEEAARLARERLPRDAAGREELELGAVAALEGLPAALARLDGLQRAAPDPARELLRAALLAAAGEDELPALRIAAERWVDHGGLRLGLLGRLFERGELEELAERAAGWTRRGPLGPSLLPLQRATAALLAGPVGSVPLEPELRPAAARWLLAVGRREAALGLRRRWPCMRAQWTPPCSPADHLRRARARLGQLLHVKPGGVEAGRAWLLLARLAAPEARGAEERARAIEAGAALLPGDPEAAELGADLALGQGRPGEALALLGPGDGWRRSPALARLRGEALLRLGRPVEAAEALVAAWEPERIDAAAGALLAEALEASAGAPAAGGVRERVARLEGSRRKAGWERFLAARDGMKRSLENERRLATYREALELDPLNEEARLSLLRDGHSEDMEADMRVVMTSIQRLPYLYVSDVIEELRGLSGLASGGRSSLRAALGRLGEPGSRPDRLLRAFLCATMVEHEGAGPEVLARGLAELDAHLAEEPDQLVAWAVRGFLELRAGLFPQAERDIAIARECAPEVAGFYRALLAAARKEPSEQVALLLEEALRGGYPRGSVELLPIYPELAPYFADTRFRERLAKLGEH